jgi:hypothetical protein
MGPGTAGATGGVDPNSCSHDVARCFEAAAACYDNAPWSDCDAIVDVCSQMEKQCSGGSDAGTGGAAPEGSPVPGASGSGATAGIGGTGAAPSGTGGAAAGAPPR